MEKTTLIKILKTLSQKEFKEFGEYVNSPFFNKNESLKKLYDYLKKQYPSFDPEKVQKEVVHKKIFPGANYNDDFMRMLIFNMNKLSEDYLAYLRMVSSGFEMKRMLAFELNERKLDKSFEKLMKKTMSELDKTTRKNGDWYRDKYYFQNENVSFLRRMYINQFEKFLKEAPLVNLHEEFTAYYLITVLKLHTFMLNIKKIYKFDKDVASFEKVIDTLDEKFLKKTPLIEIYFNLTMLLHTDKEEFLFKAKKKFFDSEDKITPYDMLDILINMQNFCSRRLRRGEIKFARELFDLYKLEVEKDLYHHYGYLHDILYKNSIEIGFQLGEIDWVKKFAEKYKNNLHPDVKDDVYAFGKAFIEFSEGNYEPALEYLAKIKLYDIHTKIEVKELTAKIYFEMKMEDMLYSLTDTFRHLIANSKLLTGNRKTANANFIKYIKRLYKINIHPTSGDLAEIRQMVKKVELLENRMWLNRKIDEISKRVKR